MLNFLKDVLTKINTYKLPLISGVLQATSYIPFPPWALFFCLVPLWFFWIKSDFKHTLIGTLVCSSVASLIGFHWVAITVHDFGQLNWFISFLVLFGFSLIANFYLVAAGLSWRFLSLHCDRNISFWLLPLITSIFMGYFPSLFPFHFGYSWIYAQFPGAQIGDILGVVSLASITMFINFLIFQAIYERKYLNYGLAAAIVFISTNTLGLIRSRFVPKETKSIEVLITQANFGNIEKQMSINKFTFREVIINKFINLSTSAINEFKKTNSNQNVDLVVWPETAYPSYVNLNSFNYDSNPLNYFTKTNKVALATGFYHVENNDRLANAILYVNPNGEISDYPTKKSILLAFGEYLPLGETFPKLKQLLPQVADFVRGPGPQARNITDIRLGPLICYESLFPWFSRQLANQNINLFINLTNDSWYDDIFEPRQHMYITAGRALENRRPVIRSTNTGISTVIKSDGTTMTLSPRSQEWAKVYTVPYPESETKTPFQKWGYGVHLLLLLILTFIVFGIGKYKLGRN